VVSDRFEKSSELRSALGDPQASSHQSPFSSKVTIPVDGQPAAFESVFLRDSCTCPACVDSSTRQKTFQTCDIPVDIEGSYSPPPRNGSTETIVINWKNDIQGFAENHQTTLPLEFLRLSIAGDHRPHISHFKPTNRIFWEKDTMTRDNVFIDYADYQSSDSTLHRALKMLESHGLVFLKNVPDTTSTDSAASLTAIMSRIGTVRSTFYGSTWDVKSVPHAKNVAYTHQFLGLHMDLCYLDLTPQFQFLHSMRARAPGGESIFADSFFAADRMRREDPPLFEALATFPVTFHYDNAGEAYRQVRRTVELTEPADLATSPIQLVNWSPPFQGPLAQDVGLWDGGARLRRFHAAVRRFNELVSDEASLFELRMKEGECVMFDNRRVLHARRAFDVGKGERWLKGGYVDRDVFASRLAGLEGRFGGGAAWGDGAEVKLDGS
jgi:alpha-ketoglutarate-dependent taurine dioxygenase